MRKKLFYSEKQKCELCEGEGVRYVKEDKEKIILCSKCFKNFYSDPVSDFKKKIYKHLVDLKNEKEIYTCNKCFDKIACKFSWDEYNTNGDCLAMK